MKVVLGMLFLALSNADFQFDSDKLTWRSYTIAKTLLTTSRIKLINKREFVETTLDENFETFVVHIATLEVLTIKPIYLSRTSQVQGSDKPILAIL